MKPDLPECGVHHPDPAGADDLGDGAVEFGHSAADQHGQFDPGQQLGRDEYGGDVLEFGSERSLDAGARAGAGGFGRIKFCNE